MVHKVSINFKSSNICSNPQSFMVHRGGRDLCQRDSGQQSKASEESGFHTLQFPPPPHSLLLLTPPSSSSFSSFSFSPLAPLDEYSQNTNASLCPRLSGCLLIELLLGSIQMSSVGFLSHVAPLQNSGEFRTILQLVKDYISLFLLILCKVGFISGAFIDTDFNLF